jgi:hypothetical protein
MMGSMLASNRVGGPKVAFALAGAFALGPLPASPGLRAAADTAAPAGFVLTLIRDPRYAACVTESGLPPAMYARTKLRVESFVLRSGERMLAVSMRDEACLCNNSSCKFTIYVRTPDARWRQVLDTYTMNDAVVRTDGTVQVDEHESVDTIAQLVYAWDGSQYDFLPDRSHEFDVGYGAKPYRTMLHFAPHRDSLTRSGVAYGTFGDSYAFIARAGQVVSLRTESRAALDPITLWYGHDARSKLQVGAGSTARLPVNGTYEFLVGPAVAGQTAHYRLWLTIR